MIVLMFSTVFCISGGFYSLKRWSKARHMHDTPTSKIRSAAQGYVELSGVLQAPDGEQLCGPLSGKPCLWWRFKIEKRSSNSWDEVESGCSEALLSLRDGTGECLIDPRGAEVRAAVRDVWEGNLRHPLANPSGHAKGGFLGWLNGNKYRYTEERLHVGQPLYAIGDFRSRDSGCHAYFGDAAQALVVREWKRDFSGLLQRFDSDANGQLDDKEWNRVRLAAKLEAEDRHRQASLQPAQHHLSKPGEAQPFILSNEGGDELIQRFYLEAAVGAFLCVGGALSTAWQLGVRTL